jgi:hypothetical protein
MSNNNLRLILPALFLLVLFPSCTHKIYDALDWQSNKVKVDGKIPEWSNPLRFYNNESKINYTITNDRRNLYLCMKISDVTAQLKILRGGMEFRIDTLGKKSFPIAFLYPIANHQMPMNNRNERQTGRDQKEKPEHSSLAQNFLLQAKELQLVGFNDSLNGVMSLFNTSSGILAAMDIDSLGILYYEAVIPFRTFYKNELTVADTNKVFGYEIKVNGIPSSQSHEGGSGNRGMSGSAHTGGMGGGSYGGGGMGGGHHGGGMSGGGNRGGSHGGNTNTSASSELNSTDKVTTKLRFSYK